MRKNASSFLLLLAAVAAPVAIVAPADAQLLNRFMFRGLEKSDIAALQPVIRDSLSEDAIGATRPWKSTSGKEGYVRLLDGGAKAGSNRGTVRITLIRADQTTDSIIFQYQQDAKGVWRTVG
ncbi:MULTISPECIES: hypothetical protein [Sphingomonas]|uniref:DUF4864 domain-containing protein n=1 Tax=Edaphosphingomonas fennica TaxID=114404 RepID=A0A2T4HPI3_9SPHN|nr:MULTISPECIES: hypothetical protein [Sphingomonas]AGH49070.1 hypothetical protein G432_06725 [Sphingomonas sp. MM-1]PTD17703.1 hypothetical protein CV103_17095 [Sphingomonas fennica]